MKPIFFACTIVLLITALFSCSKKSDVAPTPTATFTISQPMLNQTYQAGDTVRVQGKVTCQSNLHGYHLMILNSSSDTLFHAHAHTHATELALDEMWVNNQASQQDLRVIISCAVNHDGLEAVKEIPIKTLP